MMGGKMMLTGSEKDWILGRAYDSSVLQVVIIDHNLKILFSNESVSFSIAYLNLNSKLVN